MNGTLAVPLNGVDDLGKIDIDVNLGAHVTHMARWDQELFANSGPVINDIRQGGIGDCKILASALAVIIQPRGPQYILGMMKDVGRNNTQKPSLENPNCVVVRLYDSSKTPRYIRVAKKVAIDTRTLSSQGAQAAFADGPLWVSVLEQAFTALTKDGAWRPGDPKYSRIEGMSYLPLQTILGPDAKNLTIPDLADPATRSAQFSRNANSAFGGPAKFFFEQMMDPVKITDRSIQELIKKTVFPGQDALAHKFFTWADPAAVPLIPVNLPPPPTSPKIPGAVAGGQSIHLPPPPPPPVMGSTNVATFKREITDQPAKMIRYEDIEKFFHNQQLDGTTAAVILKWLETNQVVSGKKFTKLYSTWDDWVFRELQTAYNGNYPVYLSSRSNIGTPEASGASANEPKVRGLVGDHAFALVSAKLDQSRKMVTIRNPWATYGRTYGPDPTDQRPRAAEHDSPVSTLPVQEITKRFRRMVIAGISLA